MRLEGGLSKWTMANRAKGLCAVCPVPSERFYCAVHQARRNKLERARKALARRIEKVRKAQCNA